MIRRRSGWEKTSGYCTEVFFSEAIKWMNERVAAKQPFFLDLATNAPHAPYVPPQAPAKPPVTAVPMRSQAAGAVGRTPNSMEEAMRMGLAAHATGRG